MDLAKLIDSIGTALNLPEVGLSELVAGGNATANTGRIPYNDTVAAAALGTGALPATAAFQNADILSPAQTAGNTNVSLTAPSAIYQNMGSQGDVQGVTDTRGGSTANANLSNEQASYDDTLAMLEKLLGYAATKKQQGIQSIEDSVANTRGVQKKAFDTQRLQNTQAQEAGYNEVGNFANTSLNNLNRLLQGANAGRSSVGQVLAPFMVGRAADSRRKAVTDTAGENTRNIDLTQMTADQEIDNTRKSKLSEYEQAMLASENDLLGQKRQAQIGRGMASGQGYAQAAQQAQGLTSSMNDRYAQLSDLFNKYKPDYSIKEAPALSTYQVDPAKLSQGQADPTQSSFYLNQLKRKKETNGL